MSLSDDLSYPACPHCEKNRNGLFTGLSPDHDIRAEPYYCHRCRATFKGEDDA